MGRRDAERCEELERPAAVVHTSWRCHGVLVAIPPAWPMRTEFPQESVRFLIPTKVVLLSHFQSLKMAHRADLTPSRDFAGAHLTMGPFFFVRRLTRELGVPPIGRHYCSIAEGRMALWDRQTKLGGAR